MDLQEFREYVTRQRRQAHDQRTSPKDDRKEPRDVGTNQRDEPLHGNLQSGRPVKVQQT